MDQYYTTAVTRNLGILDSDEQTQLQRSRVAVAGLGGVGGIHFLTLVRMGVGAFNIADLDEFSAINANRQVGATSSTAGRKKTTVMAEMARDIHPSVDLNIYDKGVQPENVGEFLEGVDAVVDSIDYFQITARRLLHRSARELGIPVVFSAPIGFSASLHVFTPQSMSFDDYFDINDGMSLYEQLVAFTVGLCPRGTHWKYMDMNKVNLSSHSGPSIASACDISAGLMTTEIMAILLNRRPAKTVPHYVQFDPYRRLYRKGYLVFGNRGPIQRLKRWYVSRRFRDQAASFEKGG